MAIKFTFKDKEFSVGDTIKVDYKIKEKDGKERVQAFDGIILGLKHGNFIVQKNATDSVKVERIFPINSPWIDDIKKLRSPKRLIRRSKLYFLRDPHAKSI